MAKKGAKNKTSSEQVGITFSIAELVGALGLAQADWFLREGTNSLTEIIIIFDFIEEPKKIGIQAGVNCKEGTIQHFLIEKTCLREKIEYAVMQWLERKQFYEMVDLEDCQEDATIGEN